ncbi:hypothetical protein Tco_1033383 [Tanacetum coccineum]
MSSYNQRERVGCGQPCDGFYCYLCTCPQCGVNLVLGNCLNCTYGDGKPITCCGCEGPLRGGLCSFCASRNENSFDYDQKPNYFNNDQNFSDYPPQPRYERNICELCGNNAHIGYDCSLQVPFDYNQNPCFDQNFDNNFPLTSPQQYLYCENCGGPHATFQCQPMNQDFYNSNPSGFDQFQPPQFPVNYPPQETNKEILQAREDLMETIQAFLKEYDHIPPEEKCMALLLAEERFLKIKQVMEEEQNQPEVMQELLLKLMNDLQVLKGIQQEKEKPAAQSFTPYRNFSMIDDVEVLMKDIYTFLRKFSRIPFGVTPKVILIAWERFGEIKHALTDEQYQQQDIQELMSKLLEDVQNISEELSEYINCPNWNHPTIFFDDDDEDEESSIPLKDVIISGLPPCVVITPVLLTEEPVNSLSMGDEHLDTILATESDEVIKSSVEDLVPIPSEFKGIPYSVCDVPLCNNPTPLEAFKEHSETIIDFNDDSTSSDDDSPYGEDIDYVDASPPDAEIVSLEVVENVTLEDGEIEDDILHEKLSKINLIIDRIEALKDNPTPSFDVMTKSSSTSPNFFLEETNTVDNSLPKTKTFCFNLEEISSGSPTSYSDLSLLDYEAFYSDDDHIEEKSSGSTTTHVDFS